MPASKRFLQANTLDKIGRLELRAQDIVEGMLAGMHRSPYFGQSLEFRQHREYTPGDDLRHVDWKVWARQDRLYVKQFEEDTNLNLLLVVDRSRSMEYGSGSTSKFDHAATLAVCLAYLVLRQNDRVGCISFDAQVREIIPPSNRRTQLQLIADALSTVSPHDKTDLAAVGRRIIQDFPRRGLVAFISDLLAPTESLHDLLAHLRGRGHDVLVFHVMHDDELEFPFTGPIRFEGLETDDHLNCNPRSLREGYMEALTEHLKHARRVSAQFRADYQLVSTSTSIDQVLTSCLTHRMERARRK